MPSLAVLPAQMSLFPSWHQSCSCPAPSPSPGHETAPSTAQICVKRHRLSRSAILFIGSAPRPQALILLKIAAIARTYGLDLCSEAFPRSSQSIKIGIDLSVNKSIEIGNSDLIDIDCIEQSVEIGDTLVSFNDLSTDSIDLYRKIHLFFCSSKNEHFFFMEIVNLLTAELQLRVEGSNNLLPLSLKSSSDCRYWPGL